MADNIQVCVRFRPVRKYTESMPNKWAIQWEEKENKISIPSSTAGSKPVEYFVDKIFGPQHKQVDIFNSIAQPCCDHVMEGYNVTLFCYGQSGSGKTYTIFGPDEMFIDLKVRIAEIDCGIVSRAVQYIFKKADIDPDIDTIILKTACFEIYMEKIKDLLDPQTNRALKIVSSNTGPLVEGLLWKHVRTPQDFNMCIITAMQNRVMDSQRPNMSSSRSHAIVSLEVIISRAGNNKDTQAIIHFCDLAGIEKIEQTQAGADTASAAQVMPINRSLFQLGVVINQLAKGMTQVSYGDSVLTGCLRQALGGNCKSTLILSASTHSEFRAETLSSMRFAKICKMVKNKAKVNKKQNSQNLKKQILELGETVEKLENENAQLHDALRDFMTPGGPSPSFEILGSTKSNSIFNSDQKEKSKKLERGSSPLHESEKERMTAMRERTKILQEQLLIGKEVKATLEGDIDQLCREKGGLMYKLEKAEERSSELEEEKSTVLSQLKEKETEITGLLQNVNKLELQSQALNEELDSLKEENESMKQERVVLARKLSSNWDGIKGKWAAQVKTLEQQYDAHTKLLSAENEKLSMEKKAIKRLVLELRQSMKKQHKKLERLDKAHVTLKMEKDNMKLEYEKSRSEMKSMIDELTKEMSKQQEAYKIELAQIRNEGMSADKAGSITPLMENMATLNLETPAPRRPRRSIRSSVRFSDETEDAKRLKALHLAEVIAFRDQLLQESNISKEAIEREQQAYENEIAERKKQEEEDFRFSQWLQRQEEKSPNNILYGEIPKEVKRFMKILRINRELTPQEYARLNQYYEEQERERIKEANRKPLVVKFNSPRTFQQPKLVGGHMGIPDDYKTSENKLTAEQLVGLAMEPDYDFKEEEESQPSDDLSNSSDSNDHPNRLSVSGELSHSSKSRQSRVSKSKNSQEACKDSPSKSKSRHSRAEGETKGRSSRVRRRKITDHRIKMKEHEAKLEEMKQSLVAAKLKRGAEDIATLKIAIRKMGRKLEKMRRSGKAEFFGFFNPSRRIGVRLMINHKGLCQVDAVHEKGQLHKIGVRSNDIILTVNRMELSKVEDFATSIVVMRSREVSRAALGWRRPWLEEIVEDRNISQKSVQLSLPATHNALSSGGESSSPRGRPRTNSPRIFRDKRSPGSKQQRSRSPYSKRVSRMRREKVLKRNRYKYNYNDTRLNRLSRE